MAIPLPDSTKAVIEAAELRKHNAGKIAMRGNAFRFDALHGKTLKPWMMQYAHWLASEPKWPTAGMRRIKLADLTSHRIKTGKLHDVLMHRPEFTAYLDEIMQGPLEEARAKFKSHLPEYVDGHKKAFDAVVAEGDWNKVKDYTIPALERVWPRRSDGVVTNANITITLSSGQQANFDMPLPILEAELVADPTPQPASE